MDYSPTWSSPTSSGRDSGLSITRWSPPSAAGWPIGRTVSEESEVDLAIDDIHNAEGPVFINFKVSRIHPGPLKKTRDGVLMKLRFRQALIGEP